MIQLFSGHFSGRVTRRSETGYWSFLVSGRSLVHTLEPSSKKSGLTQNSTDVGSVVTLSLECSLVSLGGSSRKGSKSLESLILYYLQTTKFYDLNPPSNNVSLSIDYV